MRLLEVTGLRTALAKEPPAAADERCRGPLWQNFLEQRSVALY